MLKLGNQIKLNKDEIERITALAGESPTDITTAKGLNSFIDFHLTHYSNTTPEEKLLAALLRDEKV
jgi:hypothetical protein